MKKKFITKTKRSGAGEEGEDGTKGGAKEYNSKVFK